MKKLVSLLLALCMLLSLGAAALADDAMQAEEEYPVIAEQEMDFYLIDEDDVRTCSVFFIDGSDVPYVSLDDWAGLMVDAVKKTLTEDEPDYTLTFSMEDGIGYLTREEIGAVLTALGVRPVGAWEIVERQHVFTHVIWRMQVVRLNAEPVDVPGYGWYTGAEPLPEAFLKCLR